ncbi:MFS transporter [Sphingomonas sp. ST-64]|uniref:MFS transporter n=1 Tax=Sphingomonas plantiphila TaxID=3163295 RepID=A0ABW8YQC4_9SPHN
MLGPHRLPGDSPAPAAQSGATSATRWVLPATVLGSSMGFIDGSVVNVALPAIQSSFGAGLAAVQWVVTGYMLMLGALILIGGAMSDRLGRRRVFIWGLTGFALASLGCAVAPNEALLIVARIVQGAAAALLTPASLAIISGAYTGEARGAAIGTWAAAGAITTALGPPLGGWLVDIAGWRAIFLINLPIAAVALLLARGLPADRERNGDAPIDWAGAALAVAALGALSYGLIAFGNGAHATGGIALLGAIPLVALLLWVERRAAAPMMPLGLFASRAFSGANLLTVLLYAGLSAGLFVLPFALIRELGFSATAAGAGFLPFSIVMGAGSTLAGKLGQRIGARTMLIAGPAVTACGFALLAWSSGMASYWTGYLPGLLVVALGMTITVAPLTTTVFDAVPDEADGTASGINNAAARVGGLLAVAALGIAFGADAEGNVANGYRLVMAAAAMLAIASAIVAALTIPRRAAP